MMVFSQEEDIHLVLFQNKSILVNVFMIMDAPCGKVKMYKDLELINILRSNYMETEQCEDGRWLANISIIPGVMKYGETEKEAIVNVLMLLSTIFIDQIKQFKEREFVHLERLSRRDAEDFMDSVKRVAKANEKLSKLLKSMGNDD
jgi:hypothetical protein